MKNQKGFSLIELLIVVVIIGIIAAIAIPNLLASRRAANEGSAVSAMRTLHGASATFYATKGKNKNYAVSAADLLDQQLIDGSLWGAFGTGAGTPTGTAPTVAPKSGYNFNYAAVAPATGVPATFVLDGSPASTTGVTATGTRDFKVDGTGVIQEADSGATPFSATTFTPIG